MNIKNFNEELTNILHFQGKSDIMTKMFTRQVEDTMGKKIEGFPDNLTVITTFTNKDASPLVYQLENNKIPYINSYKNEYGEFIMTDKVKYILNALKEVKTEMVLILDGYDVLIQNFDKLIENFKLYNTRMLYNASKNNYPVVVLDKMPFRDYIGQFNCFNAGCAIGYTKDFIDFYSDAYETMNKPGFFNPYGSEQFILRTVFAKYSENMLKENPYICIDYGCKVFLALSQACIIPRDKDQKIVNAV